MRSIPIVFVSTLLLSASYTAFAGDDHHFPGIFVGMTHAEDESEFTYGF
jgi:hypothetical protein